VSWELGISNWQLGSKWGNSAISKNSIVIAES
jgi:hypothetical protein